MKLIVGLGNPGLRYSQSRHNVGFLVIKSLARDHKIALKKDKYNSALSGRGKIEGEDVILALPLTFMNLSGSAVAGLAKKYKVAFGDILVVCDDLDLDLGRIKVRPLGSSGGHRGLKSIIENLADQGFARLRVGIGRPPEGRDAADYVLSSFTRKEKPDLKNALEKVADCIEMWLKDGMEKSMNTYNMKE